MGHLVLAHIMPGATESEIDIRINSPGEQEIKLHQSDVSHHSETAGQESLKVSHSEAGGLLDPSMMMSDPDRCQDNMMKLVQRFLQDLQLSGGVSADWRK